MKLRLISTILFATLSVQAHSFRVRAPRRLAPPETWIAQESQLAINKLKENISPHGTVPGVVIASPQNQNPNYFRHWVRDAALVMDVVFQLYDRSSDANEKAAWEKMLRDYVAFSRSNQLAQGATGLGEPIFEVDGHVFQGPWGRPQNDGPALRAIALIHYAQNLLERGQDDYVRTWLYAGEIPARTVIKADLEYVSHHWQDVNFDPWEEVKGQHFFNLMVARKAMILGAGMAERLKDQGAARWYMSQAQAIEATLNSHWDAKNGLIQTTLNWAEGVNYKKSGLDISVILGSLHGAVDRVFDVTDSRVQATFEKLVQSFANLYGVNKIPVPGVALGRYPEDVYAGTDFNGGNPWVLATLAAAQDCYQRAQAMSARNLEKARSLVDQGDAYFQRVQFHANPDGSLSEQIQKDTGYMVSARDLTWNYAAVLTAAWARETALQNLKH